VAFLLPHWGSNQICEAFTYTKLKPINQIKLKNQMLARRNLWGTKELRFISFSTIASEENTRRLNKQMKNMKWRNIFGSAGQTRESNNKYNYCSADKLVSCYILDFEETWRNLAKTLLWQACCECSYLYYIDL